jgi:hypothetical protein
MVNHNLVKILTAIQKTMAGRETTAWTLTASSKTTEYRILAISEVVDVNLPYTIRTIILKLVVKMVAIL